MLVFTKINRILKRLEFYGEEFRIKKVTNLCKSGERHSTSDIFRAETHYSTCRRLTEQRKEKLNFDFEEKELFFKRYFMLSFSKQAKKGRLQTGNSGFTA